MKQYTQREFIKICIANGFCYDRHSGDHAIYINDKGRHISIPSNLECVIARRLIKENQLETNWKKLKKLKKMSYNESSRSDSNYPLMSQSDWDRAPWNEKESKEVKVDVTISQTLSRTVTVTVPENYDDYDLREAVRNQVFLPSDTNSEWEEDDFEVIKE